MIDIIRGLNFAQPWVLLAIPAIALLLLPQLFARESHPILLVADGGPILRAARGTWRIRLRWLPTALRAIAIVLLIVALARPREGLAETVLPEEGIDVIVAADISTSMSQRMPGGRTRIVALRDVLDDFVGEIEQGRLGLVAFQSRALALSPLTNDHRAIRDRVEQLNPGILPDGTAIGLGISEAVNLLQDSPALSRVVVLLTDGQNNTGDIEPMTAARAAQALGVRVYTIGFHSGNAMFEEVDREGLTQLAEITGASYFDATSEEQLSDAYREIAELESSLLGERQFTTFREFGPYFAAAAVALLALDGLLRVTWFRRQP